MPRLTEEEVLAKWEPFVLKVKGQKEGDSTELPPMNSFERQVVHNLAERLGVLHETFGEGNERHIVLSPKTQTDVNYLDCSDDDDDDHDIQGELRMLRRLSKKDLRSGEPYWEAKWMYPLRKYVRKDDAESLLGLLCQCHISLDCQPYFNEERNNEPTDLTLEILDSWGSAVSVRDFINGKPGKEDQVLKCLVDCGPTKCQAAIIGFESA